MGIKWISHRGLAQHYDENSLMAFKTASNAGFHYLETDLRTSLDGHIVLSHDVQLNNISSSTAVIHQSSRMELEGITLNQGQRLLFLDEFLVEFRQHGWVFDIKPESAIETISRLKIILKNDSTLLSQIIFLFWENKHQQYFLQTFPEAQCFPRIGECYRTGIAALSGLSKIAGIKKDKIYSLTPKFLGVPMLNKRIVQSYHRQGAQVIGYLPASKAEAQQCLHAGVDYILSNHKPIT